MSISAHDLERSETRYIRERRNVFCLMTGQKKGTKLKCILIDKYLNLSTAQKKVMGVEEKKIGICHFTSSKCTIANTCGSPQHLKIVALTSSFLHPRHFPGSSFISYQVSSSHPVCQTCLHISGYPGKR